MTAAMPSEALLSAARDMRQAGNLDGAEAACREVLVRAPGAPQAWHLLGVLRCQRGDLAGGAGLFERAVQADPRFALAWSDLGAAWRELGNIDRACAGFERAAALEPRSADALINLGEACAAGNRPEEALGLFQRAVGLAPELARAHGNLGAALQRLGRYGEAGMALERALELAPGYPEARWNRALIDLLQGRFASGWQDYEARWARKSSPAPRHTRIARWDGVSDLRTGRILLWPEQGLGDAIHFSRYAVALAAAGAQVVLEAPAPLARLFGALKGVQGIVPWGGAVPPCAWQAPLVSLPGLLGGRADRLGAPVPYLTAQPALAAAWQRRLAPLRSRRLVGLAVSGSRALADDANRSIPLAAFAPLQGLADFALLQTEYRAADAAALAAMPFHDLRAHLGDFADTAAAVQHMDLVISVDTAVAHLAGAMGKPVWILLPFVPDWRWMLDRQDSPWYPTARLFRQAPTRDWQPVIARVAQALRAWADAGQAAARLG